MNTRYLSKDREHVARLQRERRATTRRIDYVPSPEAWALIELLRGQQAPGSRASTNSALIDAVVVGWGALSGINNQRIDNAMSSEGRAGINRHGARAYDFGASLPVWGDTWLASRALKEAYARPVCGARRHRDGQPCRASCEPGRRRCRFHGGRSTGPRTPEGKARALANLRQYRPARGCV